jgi:type IV pilus assembly protein PilM
MVEFISVNPRSFGLEICDSSLKIAKVRKKFGSFRLVSFSEVSLEKGVVQGGEIKKEDKLVDSFKKAFSGIKGEKIKTKYVSFSVPEQEVFIKSIRMPDISGREFETSVYFEAENHIPLEIERMSLDFEVLGQDKMGKKVVIVASSKEAVNSYLSFLKKCNLKPLIFEPESFSSCRILKKEKAPFFLVDIKEDKINFSVFKKGLVVFSLSSDKNILSDKIIQKAQDCLNYYPDKEEIKNVIVSGSEDDLKKIKTSFLEVFKGAEFKTWPRNIFISKRKDFSLLSKRNINSLLGIALRGWSKEFYD